jgi:diguanylate cyclase (GGDEF)-like protein
VVVLSGTRGALMHEHNALLVEQLASTAEDLARTARTDELTGLGNRYGLERRLERALAAAPGTGITVYFIDIDNFKEVNDSLDHAAGDTLLRVLAERLTGVLGNEVYRVGGDEFVAVREDLDLNAAEALAAGVVAALGPPVRIGTHGVLSGASVGLARSELREDRGRRPDEPELLLRRADLALYRAKELGRGQWAAYQPWLQERADRRLAIQRGLPAALAGGQLEVHYQPIVSLVTGGMLGAEALARLATDRFGMLMPGEFLPLAQEAGLLAEVRSQVLARVVGRLATSDIAWLAVNLAASEPVPAELPGQILDALSAAGVDPSRLRLEVTETTVLDPGSRVRLAHLAEAGVQVCIEDFGTGPTSLRHLSGMGDLTLKLDRSFIAGLGRGHDDRLVIAAVVDLAHDLALRVGVEAVTTLHQAEDLRALGVEEAQGWVFGQPVPWDRLPFAPQDRPRVEHR